MKKKSGVMVLWMFASLASVPQVFAQDNARLIILSPRVGVVIDARERDQYSVFPRVAAFDSAVVVKDCHGNYYLRVMATMRDGRLSDTTIACNERMLQRIAEKIDHFEQIESGSYHIADSLPPLVESGGAVIPDRTPAVAPSPRAVPFISSPAVGSSEPTVESNRGREVSILTRFDETIIGELLSVRPEELLVCVAKDIDDDALVKHTDMILQMPIADISWMRARGHSNLG
jgi:hypothetical protein